MSPTPGLTLDPDDVLSARILYAKAPQHREHILGALAALRERRAAGHLLAQLRAEGLLDDEQVRWVEGRVSQAKRERLVQVFAHLLVAAKVPTHDVLARLGSLPPGDVAALGQGLVESGVLSAADEQRLQAAARKVLDHELSGLLEITQFRSGVFRTPITRRVAADLEALRRGVELEEEDESSETLALGATESARLLAEALAEGEALEPSDGFPPPTFLVPAWIDTSDPRRGEVLGEFRILGRVGAGAMGIVYLAQQRGRPERRVALKVLGPTASSDAKGRFKREILANSLFSHPGALEVYDAGSTPSGEQFLAMEFFEGKDAGAVLEARGGRFEPVHALWVAVCVLETLQAAHEAGVVHRDVKPGNILLGADLREVKLMDFGIAVLGDMGEFTEQVFHTLGQSISGTPEYLSPEQASGTAVVPESDVYSLGCVLYQLLAGRLPFDSESPMGYVALHMLEEPCPLAKAAPDVAARLPRELLELLARMLSKESEERPRAGAAAAELRRILATLDPSGSTTPGAA